MPPYWSAVPIFAASDCLQFDHLGVLDGLERHRCLAVGSHHGSVTQTHSARDYRKALTGPATPDHFDEIPVSGAKFQISTAGGLSPAWNRDGREIYFLSPDQKMMVSAVKINGSSFEPSTPQALFTPAGASGFAVTRDGQRFLVNVPAGGESAASGPPLTLVTNWIAVLKK